MKISIWDILSVLALLGTFAIILVALTIFSNPNSGFNPFPPPTAPAPIVLPTATATLRSLPPTWTATAEGGVSAGGETPRITSTLPPTSTQFVLYTFTPTNTPTVTPTSTSTPTSTPTITRTPTVTRTPSLTPTRTNTLEPTNTSTTAPTFTNTPGLTQP
jgi:hypothetical protein